MFSVPTNRFVPKHETQNFVKKAELFVAHPSTPSKLRQVFKNTLVSVSNTFFGNLFPHCHGTLISAFYRVFHFHKSTRKAPRTTLNICYNNICYSLLPVQFSDCSQSRQVLIYELLPICLGVLS
jgi:hypothetical protein